MEGEFSIINHSYIVSVSGLMPIPITPSVRLFALSNNKKQFFKIKKINQTFGNVSKRTSQTNITSIY